MLIQLKPPRPLHVCSLQASMGTCSWCAAALRLSTTWWCRLRFICESTLFAFCRAIRYWSQYSTLPVAAAAAARLPVHTLLLTWVATKRPAGSDCLRNASELVRIKVIFDDNDNGRVQWYAEQIRKSRCWWLWGRTVSMVDDVVDWLVAALTIFQNSGEIYRESARALVSCYHLRNIFDYWTLNSAVSVQFCNGHKAHLDAPTHQVLWVDKIPRDQTVVF